MTKKQNEIQEKTNQEDQRPETEQNYRFFRPSTDIIETDKDLVLYMDMPGVNKDRVDIKLEKDVLSVEGRINSEFHQKSKPVHKEYRVGHYARSFTLSNVIDQTDISAKLDDGVLVLTLPKVPEKQPKQIAVS